MKTVLSVAVIIASALLANADISSKAKQKIIEHGLACIGSTGVDKMLVLEARQGRFTDDPKLKAFAFCMSKKLGLQNEAGEPQNAVIKEKLGMIINDDAVVDQLITKCVLVHGTPEESAAKAFKCYYENTPTHVSLL